MNKPNLVKIGILCENCLRIMPGLKTEKRKNRKYSGKQTEFMIIFNPPGFYQLCGSCKSTSEDEVKSISKKIMKELD